MSTATRSPTTSASSIPQIFGFSRELSITPKIPLDGVGRNLIDHAGVGFSCDAPPGTVDENTPVAQVLLRYTAMRSTSEARIQATRLPGPPEAAIVLRSKILSLHLDGNRYLLGFAVDVNEPTLNAARRNTSIDWAPQ